MTASCAAYRLIWSDSKLIATQVSFNLTTSSKSSDSKKVNVNIDPATECWQAQTASLCEWNKTIKSVHFGHALLTSSSTSRVLHGQRMDSCGPNDENAMFSSCRECLRNLQTSPFLVKPNRVIIIVNNLLYNHASDYESMICFLYTYQRLLLRANGVL